MTATPDLIRREDAVRAACNAEKTYGSPFGLDYLTAYIKGRQDAAADIERLLSVSPSSSTREQRLEIFRDARRNVEATPDVRRLSSSTATETGELVERLRKELTPETREDYLSRFWDCCIRGALLKGDKSDGPRLTFESILDFKDELIEEAAARIAVLEGELAGCRAFERNINEALNSGDGTYRP